MAITSKPKLRNCIQCGKVFLSQNREDLCDICRVMYYELEEKVKNYVKNNPGVNMAIVAEETGVSKKLIQRMAREGTFMDMPMGENFMYACASCGTPIKTGTYCTSCLMRLRRETQKVSESMNIRMNENMPTIQRLDALAQREFEAEKRDRRTYRAGLTNIGRSR